MLEKLFKKLDKSIVLRNYLQLPRSTGGSDLDITIPNESLRETEELLFQIAKESNGYLVSFIPSKTCPKYCFQGKDWGVQIDLFVGGISFNEKMIFPYSVLQKYSIEYNGIAVLDNSCGDIISFMKEILNNLSCKIKYYEAFFEARSEPLLNNLLSPLFSNQFLGDLMSLQSYESVGIYNIGVKARKELGFSSSKIFVQKLPNIIKRLASQPGYTIAFLGTDGSGKSTIIDAITPVLNQAFHNSVYYEHMRPNKFLSIARLLGRKEDFSALITDPHAQKSSGFIGSVFRFSYYYLDFTVGYLLKVFPRKAFKSCVWIFDRYYYDYLLDQKRARIKLPKFIIKIGAFFMPKPDVIICLGTDAEKIYNRKPEISFIEVQRQVATLKVFCNQNKRAVWIDTGLDVETSKQACLQHITSFMANRFKHLNQ